ncbi:MAG TPA: thioredoxin family protein [Vicinamibacterales bacterium]|jgi:thiol:disulfide interchange protein
MNRQQFRAAGLVILALGGAGLPLCAQGRPPAKATVAAFVETARVAPGSDVHAALRIKLPEGFHTNSNRPRDPSLIPIAVTLGGEAPAGVAIDELVFPAATELKQRGADQPLLVFEGEFTIGVALKVAPDMKPGAVSVPVRVRYQACDETMCYIPTSVDAQWAFAVASGAPGAKQHADVFRSIKFGTGERPVAAASSGPATAPGSSRPAGDGGSRAAAADPVQALQGFSIQSTAAGYLGTDDFLTFVRNAEAGVKEQGMFEGRGPLAILLIVLIGGLALNLTPCVLPMIPINLAIIGAGTQAGSRTRGFLLGGAYGAAMAVVYGALGLIVILTASTFGTINASPWFNLGIAALFIALGLAMFDVITIDFSRYSDRFKVDEASRGSFLVAFAMGGVAALLAGACVAPVVVQVVLFSSNLYAGGTRAALALPFFLGMGMAIPWPIAGAGIAALPRPGAWMVRIKQVFGVVILATAAYYGYEAYGLFANRWVDPTEVSSSVQAKLKEGWHASLAEGLAAAEREGKPVLIDMWATWCKNCLVMDRTTLEDPAVNAALNNYVKVKFQAEDPDEPKVAAVMKHFNAAGLPTYAIIKPR